jgi:hypothetical protein
MMKYIYSFALGYFVAKLFLCLTPSATDPEAGFDSRYYQKKKVVGPERDPLSLVSTTKELLDRKVAAPV